MLLTFFVTAMMPPLMVVTFLKFGDYVSHRSDEMSTPVNDIPLLCDDDSKGIALRLIEMLFTSRFLIIWEDLDLIFKTCCILEQKHFCT